MYFLENNLAGESGSERGDSYLQKVEGAVSQTIARAIRDATQSSDAARRQEAASWLMICCPDIAEQMELPELRPELYSDAMPALAAAYLTEKNGL
jgi:hypothetical protein